jgi:hypothetical protein
VVEISNKMGLTVEGFQEGRNFSTLDIHDTAPEVVLFLLQYIYCDNINVIEVGEHLLQLLELSYRVK